eukprot:CAMPEP_0173062478 /NCGR_PEP_ID=MMETSP1102-20130122/3836_1 /TAXON_ID=49646 /ORGANISM="Geminigera sp., Strain Caron Lab Isolate" /LENGTH=115 /DNA_ID=CAMNT_0013929145 /DNA_START=627 /DNA_END=971 /DNA_ORIENTATION=+
MAISLRRRLLQPAFIVREALVRNPDGVGLPVPVAVESVHLVQKPRALHSPARHSVTTRHPIAVGIERTPLIARRRSPAFTCSVVEYRIIRLGSHSVTDEAELREEHPPPVAPLRP